MFFSSNNSENLTVFATLPSLPLEDVVFFQVAAGRELRPALAPILLWRRALVLQIKNVAFSRRFPSKDRHRLQVLKMRVFEIIQDSPRVRFAPVLAGQPFDRFFLSGVWGNDLDPAGRWGRSLKRRHPPNKRGANPPMPTQGNPG